MQLLLETWMDFKAKHDLCSDYCRVISLIFPHVAQKMKCINLFILCSFPRLFLIYCGCLLCRCSWKKVYYLLEIKWFPFKISVFHLYRDQVLQWPFFFFLVNFTRLRLMIELWLSEPLEVQRCSGSRDQRWECTDRRWEGGNEADTHVVESHVLLKSTLITVPKPCDHGRTQSGP